MIKGKLEHKGPGIGEPFQVGSIKVAWVERPESMGLRLIGFADEIGAGNFMRGPVDHRGWFLHPECFPGEVARGVLYQLPGRRGNARIVCGMADPFNDNGAALLALWDIEEGPPDLYGLGYSDVIREAARGADYIAEKYAEAEREYQTAWQAGAAWEALGEELSETRRAFFELRRDTRAPVEGATPAICAILRRELDKLADRWREIKESRSRLKNGDSEPWHFWPGDRRLADAFNEGAGEVVL